LAPDTFDIVSEEEMVPNRCYLRVKLKLLLDLAVPAFPPGDRKKPFWMRRYRRRGAGGYQMPCWRGIGRVIMVIMVGGVRAGGWWARWVEFPASIFGPIRL
jgi:hypothetical protein